MTRQPTLGVICPPPPSYLLPAPPTVAANARGVSEDHPGRDQVCALYMAIEGGHVEIATLLLDAGADVVDEVRISI